MKYKKDITVVSVSLLIVTFLIIRISDIIAYVCTNVLALGLFICLLITFVSLFFRYSKHSTSKLLVLIILTLQLKNDIDVGVTVNNVIIKDLTEHVCIVTGANSGTGYAITQQLYDLNCNVIMACRSIVKCRDAATKIENNHNQLVIQMRKRNITSSTYPVYIRNNSDKKSTITVMELDLTDLHHVKSFTDKVKSKYSHVDVLVNNAGSLPPAGSLTKQGYEEAIGAMHIGHFALTKWLYSLLLRKNKKTTGLSRVINVSSGAYLVGSFDSSLLLKVGGKGDSKNKYDLHGEVTDNCPSLGPYDIFNCCPLLACPYTNGYARAKLANLLTTHELQKRSDLYALNHPNNRRLVAASLHPGSVSTNIIDVMKQPLMSALLRKPMQASYVILHAILADDFVPGSYLDPMKCGHDLLQYKSSGGIYNHYKAYPSTLKLQFANNATTASTLYSLDEAFFQSKSFVHVSNTSDRIHTDVTHQELSKVLYDVTEGIIRDFEYNRLI